MESIKNHISFDALSGDFFWISGRLAGRKAGTLDRSTGYVRIQFRRKIFYAHRLAWFMAHNEWPHQEIDHIDGIRSNNSINNLRIATRTQQTQNKVVRKDSVSQLKGAYRNNGRWRSEIKVNGKKIYLGTFSTPLLAHKAYCKAAKKYFGEFSHG